MLGMRRASALGLLIALLATSGCGSDPSLRSLEKDPTASFVVPGTHLEHESKHKSGTTLGMPVHASITRRFSLGEVAPEDAVARAAQFAMAHGWAQEFSPDGSFSATKRIDAIRAELLVTAPTYDRTDVLYLYLNAY
jgi:hypothetical protein